MASVCLSLIKHRHKDQIVVGGDIARRTMYRHDGEGGLGLGYILESWVPRFIEQANEAGYDGQALFRAFFIDNPRRAFVFKP
ncbi:hypothetical protein BJF92_07855 [Rhizobium rhizosphaerae]|uniref:Phosphotriesterase n=1 Tax=Xaviernesmea rhizosphaerae TaxID=1672749 RepID=A0A1Q9AK28_9HYPH|nr:hypothetical protein [Xaviernesmea rhizosphaerae]OLP55583.1 hypothetical protein BJF92_07855 [Xaviernesmea rhizosphaerae]